MRSTFRRLIPAAAIAVSALGILGGSIAAAAPAAPAAAAAHPFVYMHT